MSTTAIAATGYQTLSLTRIHESPTNPRRTFEPTKLAELAESLRIHGLVQPITVRPDGEGFEIVAGARRFRAAQLAGLTELEAIVRQLSDAETLEVQIIENSQRQDVHPYEEAAGYQRLLDLPGYDVAALASKCGKSLSHVYARLTLLQLIPDVAEAFQQERISASHANLLARLTGEQQAEAFQQCWRKDYQDKEPHLLPAKHLSVWIQDSLYLPLGEAAFSTEDPTLNPEAGACVTCPRRSGFNTQLFADLQGDHCFVAPCYQSKVTAMLDREIAAHPEFVQIETSWRSPREQRPGILQSHQYWTLKTPENPDAEPPCDRSRTALIVYGKGVGKTFPVCTDRDCPVHDPRQAAYRKENPAPVIEPPTEEENEEEAASRRAEYEQREAEYRAEQERRQAEGEAEEQRREQEAEADREHRDKLTKTRKAIFERIVQAAPPVFNAHQLRVLLRALVNIDPYTFADDLAVEFNGGEDENDQRSAEEILLSAIGSLTDDKLTGFAVHLALAGHRGLPRDSEFDFLTEAEAVFTPKEKPAAGKKKTPAKAAQKPATKPAAAEAATTKANAKKATQTRSKA